MLIGVSSLQALLVRLTALGVPRAAAPKRLYNQEDEDTEIDTGAEPDQLIQQLLSEQSELYDHEVELQYFFL